MHGSVLPILALVLMVIASAAGGQPSGTGSVTGQVTLTTRIRGTALPSSAYPSRAVGRRATPSIPEIRNVVVYLKDPGARSPLTIRRSEVRQENETFLPHVLAVTRGSTVDFPNNDPFFHNVFSLSGAANFNLGRYPRGQTRSQTFQKPGIVKVFCQIHSHMSATILIFDHPYFAVPEMGGMFNLPDLPPGEYTIVGWHERVGERTATVRVQAGRATSVNLSLPVEDAQ